MLSSEAMLRRSRSSIAVISRTDRSNGIDAVIVFGANALPRPSAGEVQLVSFCGGSISGFWMTANG